MKFTGTRRMIALDTNLLVYAYREDSEFHTIAMEQIRPVIEGDSPWALPWTCVHEFIGVVPVVASISQPRRCPVFLLSRFADASPQLHLLAESPAILKSCANWRWPRNCPAAHPRRAHCRAVPAPWRARTLDRRPRLFHVPEAQTRNPLVKK